MFKYILFLVIFIMSCGKEKEKEPTLTYPQELSKYIDRYIKYKKEGVGRDINIVFSDNALKDNPNINATCTYETGYIQIYTRNWDAMNELERERVVFHELGHCDLRRSHTKTMLDDKCMTSIMHTPAITGCYTEETRLYYIQELFN